MLLVSCVFLAALLSHVIPAGEYERHLDPVTGRKVVVAGSYHSVEPHRFGFFEAAVALPQGMAEAGSVIFLVFLIGGAFSVVDQTGAFNAAVQSLAQKLEGRITLIIPILCVVFSICGALEGMWEEIIALMPVLLLLARRVGFDPLTMVAASLGAAGIGSTFSPMNPFSVGVAQQIAELSLLSGWQFRLLILIVALTIWIIGTMRYAARHRCEPDASAALGAEGMTLRHAIALGAVLGAFVVYVFGTLRLGWGFDEMSALFFLMGLVVGLLGGLGWQKTAEAYVEGFKSMAYAAVLIGVARAIFVVLDRGRIIDTMINAMVTPLANLGPSLFATGMTVVQTAIAVPVPSTSGRAILTMPIMVPLSDLIGVSRQVTVLTYQYGAGVIGQMLPTDGALMAILATAGVRYEKWVRFAAPLCVILFLLCIAAILLAVAIGLK